LLPVVVRVTEIGLLLDGLPRMQVKGHIVMADGHAGKELTTLLPVQTGIMQAVIAEVEIAFGREAIKFFKGCEIGASVCR
jgi:hypothetical protein